MLSSVMAEGGLVAGGLVAAVLTAPLVVRGRQRALVAPPVRAAAQMVVPGIVILRVRERVTEAQQGVLPVQAAPILASLIVVVDAKLHVAVIVTKPVREAAFFNHRKAVVVIVLVPASPHVPQPVNHTAIPRANRQV